MSGERCRTCAGNGYYVRPEDGVDLGECETCGGSGVDPAASSMGYGDAEEDECQTCGGSGRVVNRMDGDWGKNWRCPTCDGDWQCTRHRRMVDYEPEDPCSPEDRPCSGVFALSPAQIEDRDDHHARGIY